MGKIAVLLVAVAAWIVAGNALAAGDAAAGKSKSTACGACHGPDGNSTNPLWPKLAGQHAAYLVKQLEAFKSGERKDALMSPMAAGLSEEDMEDLAAFFAGQNQR
jgi:cytochrome c553